MKFVVAVILFTMFVFIPESSLAAGDDQGPIFFTGLSGSYFDPGWQLKLNTAGGYQFNRHFEITSGLPVYFVSFPAETAEDTPTSNNGIGDLYFDARVMAPYPRFYFSSGIRVTAPTGSKEEGLSTGKVTYDWNNYFEYSLGNWTPFGSAGIANSISDTHFLNRPFSSFGFVGQFEGGLLFDPFSWIGFGASGYAVVPSGEQEVYFRRMGRGGSQTGGSGSGTGRGSLFGMYDNIVTEAEDLSDQGFSAWLDIYAIPNVALAFGYSRSAAYDYNTLFFSTRFNIMGMIRKSRD